MNAPAQFVAALKVGDILYSSWGYDQTNIDFYEVTKGGRAGQMIELRELKTSSTPERGFMTADKVPVFGEGRFAEPSPNVIGDTTGVPFKRKLRTGYQGAPSVKIESYAYASPWDGTPKRYSWYA